MHAENERMPVMPRMNKYVYTCKEVYMMVDMEEYV